MQVIRRRDGALLDATLTTDHANSSDGIPVLVIAGETYGPAETHGYLLKEADAGELAELRRWGYSLLAVRKRSA
jgi:hypothetical protein